MMFHLRGGREGGREGVGGEGEKRKGEENRDKTKSKLQWRVLACRMKGRRRRLP